MLDPRIYRAAFVPVLLAIIVAAFSLADRPRPIGTTLAPDAFLGSDAAKLLADLAGKYPDRRPGSAGDEALAERIRGELRVLGPRTLHVQRFNAETIDGDRTLENVIASRPGAPGPGIVVVAHRDAAARGAKAELSGTAALVELARVVSDGRLNHTITFVSTSGGSGGAAGAAAAVARLPRPIDAVLVLGNLTGRSTRRPFVTAYSNTDAQAPLQLRRTLDASLKLLTARDPGAPRAVTQWARLALPLTIGEQGELARKGLGAVLLQTSGERPPAADEPVDAALLEKFGRAALRTIYALDNGPPLATGPEVYVVTQRKVLPLWAVRLVVGMLLLPPLLAAVDGLARVRRRREPVGRRLRWVLAAALPFFVAALFLRVLAWTGLIAAAPSAPVPPGAMPVDGAAKGVLVAAALVFALGWLLRPLTLRAFAARPQPGESAEGATAAAIALVVCAAAIVAWVFNPFAAGLLVVPANVWLLVAAPEVRLPRALGLLAVVAALLPLALVTVVDAHTLGYAPLGFTWFAALLVAGGHFGPASWLLWSVVGGCAVAAGAAALQPQPPGPAPAEVTMRGPMTYAGPGSLGGTESALRR